MAKFIFHDPFRCNGCGDCEKECQKVQGLTSPWSKPLRVVKGDVTLPNGETKRMWVRKSCCHCEPMNCIPACKPGAIQQRPDGVVWIEAALCDGCKDCISVCKNQAIIFDMVSRKAIKCDLCKNRIDQGHRPACVLRCEFEALFFGTAEEWEVVLQERIARRMAQT